MIGKAKSHVLSACLAAILFWQPDVLQALELQRREMPVNRFAAKRMPAGRQYPTIEVPIAAENRAPKAKKTNYREGEVLVRLKPGLRARTAEMSFSSGNMRIAKRFKALSRIKGKEYVHIRKIGMKAAELKQLLEKDPLVDAVSLNYVKQLDANGGCGGTIPDDPSFDSQWALCNTGQEILGLIGTPDADVDATEAWGIQSGAADVVVAVLDTGVDYLHPDLADNMWVNQVEAGGIPGVDDDGNGYVDDMYGIDTGEDDSDPMDIDGHGTHVAGTIAAEGDNGQGTAGISWHAKIMAVKGFKPDGFMDMADELEALDYILDLKLRGVNIVAINASFGCSFCFSDLEKDAIEAAGNEGIAFVAAAGNDGVDIDVEPHYPAAYDSPNIVSVAATNSNDGLAIFSNYGQTSVDLGAPGEIVLSTYSHNWYNPGQGSDLFFDDMESGIGTWSVEGPWAITVEQALSPTHAWSDSPGGSYGNNSAHRLTSQPIDLSNSQDDRFLGFTVLHDLEEEHDFLDIYCHALKTSVWGLTDEKAHSGAYAWSDSPNFAYPDLSDNWLASPEVDASAADDEAQVVFWLIGELEDHYDYLDVYFSADGGLNWAYQGSHTGRYGDKWYQLKAWMAPEFRTAQFRVAFVLWSGPVIAFDGIYIDDIEIRDSTTIFFSDDMESGPGDWGQTVTNWDLLATLVGSSDGIWYSWNIPIDRNSLWSEFRIRFVLNTDFSFNYDGLYLDDIGIGRAEPTHSYAYLDGTSMAAPHVSGAVALLAAEYPAESLDNRIQRILTGVNPIGSLTGKVVSDGRMNLYESLITVSPGPCAADFTGDKDVDGNDLASFITNPQGISLADFASNFARTDCP